MAEFIYADNSNVFFEGKRIAAVRHGKARNLAQASKKGIEDNSFRLGFGSLYNLIADNNPEKVKRTVLFGSSPPQNDAVLAIAEQAGFEAIVVSRNAENREKKVDTEFLLQWYVTLTRK